MEHKAVEVSDECTKSSVPHDVQLGSLAGQGINGQAKEHGAAKPFQL